MCGEKTARMSSGRELPLPILNILAWALLLEVSIIVLLLFQDIGTKHILVILMTKNYFFMIVSVLGTQTISAIITCLPFRAICLSGIKTELRKNNLWLVGLQTERNQMLTA